MDAKLEKTPSTPDDNSFPKRKNILTSPTSIASSAPIYAGPTLSQIQLLGNSLSAQLDHNFQTFRREFKEISDLEQEDPKKFIKALEDLAVKVNNFREGHRQQHTDFGGYTPVNNPHWDYFKKLLQYHKAYAPSPPNSVATSPSYPNSNSQSSSATSSPIRSPSPLQGTPATRTEQKISADVDDADDPLTPIQPGFDKRKKRQRKPLPLPSLDALQQKLDALHFSSIENQDVTNQSQISDTHEVKTIHYEDATPLLDDAPQSPSDETDPISPPPQALLVPKDFSILNQYCTNRYKTFAPAERKEFSGLHHAIEAKIASAAEAFKQEQARIQELWFKSSEEKRYLELVTKFLELKSSLASHGKTARFVTELRTLTEQISKESSAHSQKHGSQVKPDWAQLTQACYLLQLYALSELAHAIDYMVFPDQTTIKFNADVKPARNVVVLAHYCAIYPDLRQAEKSEDIAARLTGSTTQWQDLAHKSILNVQTKRASISPWSFFRSPEDTQFNLYAKHFFAYQSKLRGNTSAPEVMDEIWEFTQTIETYKKNWQHHNPEQNFEDSQEHFNDLLRASYVLWLDAYDKTYSSQEQAIPEHIEYKINCLVIPQAPEEKQNGGLDHEAIETFKRQNQAEHDQQQLVRLEHWIRENPFKLVLGLVSPILIWQGYRFGTHPDQAKEFAEKILANDWYSILIFGTAALLGIYGICIRNKKQAIAKSNEQLLKQVTNLTPQTTETKTGRPTKVEPKENAATNPQEIFHAAFRQFSLPLPATLKNAIPTDTKAATAALVQLLEEGQGTKAAKIYQGSKGFFQFEDKAPQKALELILRAQALREIRASQPDPRSDKKNNKDNKKTTQSASNEQVLGLRYLVKHGYVHDAADLVFDTEGHCNALGKKAGAKSEEIIAADLYRCSQGNPVHIWTVKLEILSLCEKRYVEEKKGYARDKVVNGLYYFINAESSQAANLLLKMLNLDPITIQTPSNNHDGNSLFTLAIALDEVRDQGSKQTAAVAQLLLKIHALDPMTGSQLVSCIRFLNVAQFGALTRAMSAIAPEQAKKIIQANSAKKIIPEHVMLACAKTNPELVAEIFASLLTKRALLRERFLPEVAKIFKEDEEFLTLDDNKHTTNKPVLPAIGRIEQILMEEHPKAYACILINLACMALREKQNHHPHLEKLRKLPEETQIAAIAELIQGGYGSEVIEVYGKKSNVPILAKLKEADNPKYPEYYASQLISQFMLADEPKYSYLNNRANTKPSPEIRHVSQALEYIVADNVQNACDIVLGALQEIEPTPEDKLVTTETAMSSLSRLVEVSKVMGQFITEYPQPAAKFFLALASNGNGRIRPDCVNLLLALQYSTSPVSYQRLQQNMEKRNPSLTEKISSVVQERATRLDPEFLFAFSSNRPEIERLKKIFTNKEEAAALMRLNPNLNRIQGPGSLSVFHDLNRDTNDINSSGQISTISSSRTNTSTTSTSTT